MLELSVRRPGCLPRAAKGVALLANLRRPSRQLNVVQQVRDGRVHGRCFARSKSLPLNDCCELDGSLLVCLARSGRTQQVRGARMFLAVAAVVVVAPDCLQFVPCLKVFNEQADGPGGGTGGRVLLRASVDDRLNERLKLPLRRRGQRPRLSLHRCDERDASFWVVCQEQFSEQVRSHRKDVVLRVVAGAPAGHAARSFG
mmetsp:Transcript_6564/g.21259  ORF Transcript_6564/g.21259 Transcript_6564/m.21259 type:complete len:200 (+) Transcript_6564:511-1110(+)